MTIAVFLLFSALSADFTVEKGELRPELHSSGWGPKIASCSPEMIADIRAMGFKAARTHDWALVDGNQRVCDNHHLFPLAHLDPKDPKNYVFGPTDYLLKRTREETGLEIFFRLGTSIEHSGKVHFNAAIPDDLDRVVENFAMTVRHYRGQVRDWEIWNEPDGDNTMWCLPEGDEAWHDMKDERYFRRRQLYVDLFVKSLKRLKGEFGDSIRVGGPALCCMSVPYFEAILDGCRKAGVAPDFISWHHYIANPDIALKAIDRGRELCDRFGFTKCQLVINEWHYLKDGNWGLIQSKDPAVREKAWTGPDSHAGIDSSCFNLSLLSAFQHSRLDQSFYYGCGAGDWGYQDRFRRKYKIFHGLCLFGDFLKAYRTLCASAGEDPDGEPFLTVLAAKTPDGARKGLLVTDYRTRATELRVEVKGVAADAHVTACVHDLTRDREPVAVTFRDGVLILPKRDAESAAFLVEFAKE